MAFEKAKPGFGVPDSEIGKAIVNLSPDEDVDALQRPNAAKDFLSEGATAFQSVLSTTQKISSKVRSVS